MTKWVWYVLLTILLVVPVFQSAELTGYSDFDSIVVNSRDWHDVYTGINLGHLIKKNAYFVRKPEVAVFLAEEVKGDRILLIEPQNNKMHNSFSSLMESKGFDVQLMSSDDINYEVFENLDVEGYIFIDPTYGYDAMSVAPYASLIGSYVVFVNRENIDEIVAEDVLLYGDLDQEVLDRYPDSDMINNGNRFDNNIEIVKRSLERKDIGQVKLSNGEFIERNLFNPDTPLLFVGSSRVPDSVMEYLAGSDLQVGTLVGNDLADHVTSMKRRLKSAYDKDFGVLLMVGKSSVSEGQGEAAIRSLDIFPIETFDANLSIESVIYNQLLDQIEVTISNNNDLKVYFLTTINIDGREGLGDDEIQFIPGNKIKTLVYPVDLGIEDILGDVLIIYGEESGSLERQYQLEFNPMQRLDIDDRSEIEISKIVYDRPNKAVRVTIENTGDVTAYVDLELSGIIVEGEETILSTPKPRRLEAGEKQDIPVRVKFSSLDLEEMDLVKVKAYYGQRENALFKVKETDLLLEITNMTYYVAGIVVLIAIFILIVFASLRKRKKSRL